MRNLLDFLARYYHWMLFAVLEALSVVLLVQYNSYQGSVWLSSANVLTGKLFEVSSKVESYFALGEANEQLARRNFYLERQVRQLRTLYAEQQGDTLAADSSQQRLLAQFQLVEAKVVSNEVAGLHNLITIDRGSQDGVAVDMGVVCGTGLVGVVYLVSDHYSIVMPVLNVKTHISCAIRHRGYFGYLQWYGGDASVAYVEDVPRHAHFKRGDYVETSGFSAIFPPGVLVGKIVEVYNSRDGLSYRLKVQLSTDFARLRDVFVVSDRSIGERARLLQAARDSLKLNVSQ